jgi:hypothetical protein
MFVSLAIARVYSWEGLRGNAYIQEGHRLSHHIQLDLSRAYHHRKSLQWLQTS